MIKHLTQHGENWALILDKPMLDSLNIAPDTPLELSTDGRTLTIAPAIASEGSSRVEESLAKINRKYGDVLKKLAE